jgi:very-short-patch-repair endonuclease
VVDKERTAPERHFPLKALATRQHGVVSTRQLKALGYTRQSASKANGVGRLHRVHRGVYAVGHTDLRWEGRCMAAVLACAPAVASHWTAAWLLALLRTRRSALHLTAPSRRHRKPDFVVHFAQLGPEDVEEADGIPVTSLERTHLDIAARWPDALGDMFEAAETSRRFDLRKFDALLARSAHHPGYGPLSKALRAYRPELVVLRSNLERDFRALIRASGLPLPSSNFNVGPYELDCYWEAERFCVELDVYATHGSRRSFEADREREDDLLLAGIGVMRVTDVRLEREPQRVIERVAAHLERRRPRPVN